MMVLHRSQSTVIKTHSKMVTLHLVKCKCRCNGGNVCRQDVEVQQPWNIGLGVSMDMGNNQW